MKRLSVESRKIRSVVPLLTAWFTRNARDLPWRHTLDPYAIWISEIMLQQTQVKTVTPYWTRWLHALPDAHALAAASQRQVLRLWEGLGYYSRAHNLQKAAQIIVKQHGGRFPERFDEVLALPGVGRYTAGAICSISFNQPAPVLDGNVIRVLTRLFAVDGDPRATATNELLWQLAQELVTTAESMELPSPDRRGLAVSGLCSLLNQALMELGALVCTARQPRCLDCPARRHCAALKQHRVGRLPGIRRSPRPAARYVIAFAVEHRGRWLVRQRAAGMVNAHLWEFPNLEVNGHVARPAEFIAQFGWRASSLEPLPVIKHSITRYRIEMRPFRIEVIEKPDSGGPNSRWCTRRQIEALPLTSAHRKLWGQLRPTT